MCYFYFFFLNGAFCRSMCDDFWNIICRRIGTGRVGGLTEKKKSAINNQLNKLVTERPTTRLCVNEEINRNLLVGLRIRLSRSQLLPGPSKLEVDNPPFNVQSNGWGENCEIECIQSYSIDWRFCDAMMNTFRAFSKSPKRWPAIEHNMWGHRAAWSPLWR